MLHGGLTKWLSDKESICLCRRCQFNPWVGKILWKRKWQPTPVFLPGKSHKQRSLERLQSMGSQRVSHTHTHIHTNLYLKNLCFNLRKVDFQFGMVSVMESSMEPLKRFSGGDSESWNGKSCVQMTDCELYRIKKSQIWNKSILIAQHKFLK